MSNVAKKVLIKPIIKFDIVSIVTDIMFLKEKTFMIDYESTDMIDFLFENKKIKDFNVSKSTFYRKINKFCWCLMVVIYVLMYYIYSFKPG